MRTLSVGGPGVRVAMVDVATPVVPTAGWACAVVTPADKDACEEGPARTGSAAVPTRTSAPRGPSVAIAKPSAIKARAPMAANAASRRFEERRLARRESDDADAAADAATRLLLEGSESMRSPSRCTPVPASYQPAGKWSQTVVRCPGFRGTKSVSYTHLRA